MSEKKPRIVHLFVASMASLTFRVACGRSFLRSSDVRRSSIHSAITCPRCVREMSKP